MDIDTRCNPSKRFKHSRGVIGAKHYYKSGDMFYVRKSIKGKSVNFGYYKTEEEAQKVVEELKKVNWDKRELHRIIEELGV